MSCTWYYVLYYILHTTYLCTCNRYTYMHVYIHFKGYSYSTVHMTYIHTCTHLTIISCVGAPLQSRLVNLPFNVLAVADVNRKLPNCGLNSVSLDPHASTM